MKKSILLMAGLLAMALAGSAQAATMFAVQNAGAVDQFTVADDGSFSTPGSFKWDNVNKRLGIGTDAPVAPFQIFYTTNIAPFILERELNNSGAITMQADNYGVAGSGSLTGSGMLFRYAKGTKAAPAAVAVGDRLGFLVFGGQPDATVGNFKHTGAINALVDAGTVSATSLPTYIQFQTTPNGSVARLERLRIAADGRLRVTNQPAAPTNGAACTDAGDLILDAANGFLYLCGGGVWKRATFL